MNNKPIDFWTLLQLVQENISHNYAALLNEKNKHSQLRPYIQKFLRDSEYEVDGVTFEELTERIIDEMANYSILTKYLGSSELEEININSWDDIAVTFLDGSIVKLKESFRSPQHAIDIMKRLLQHSKMSIDNGTPIAQGHLPNNTRITVLISPVVDEDVGVSASIRLLHPQKITREMLLNTDFATEKMLDFITTCIRYGVSVVVAGATSTGKTTLINCLLGEIPDDKRIYTIESGARELSLVKRKDEKVMNNVVHTLSQPSDDPNCDISPDRLVVSSLRFSPEVIVVGEMRDKEASSAVEASLTGHTVVTTVHSLAGSYAHTRIGLLCQKSVQIEFNTSLQQAGMAFPIVVYTHKLENNARKIMDISECVMLPNGERKYRTLFRYNITKNTVKNDKYSIEGEFVQPDNLSENLQQKLMQYGIPQDVLQRFRR